MSYLRRYKGGTPGTCLSLGDTENLSYLRIHIGGTQCTCLILGSTRVGPRVLVLALETQGWDT